MYRQGKSLKLILSTEEQKTRTGFACDYGQAVELLGKLLDAQFEIVDNTAWLLGQSHLNGRDASESAIFSAVHKNFFLFHSALTLAQSGMYGPAETLLRPIFESLYIAKFCSSMEKSQVFSKWIEGEYVHLTNEVFNKIRTTDLAETRIFWKSLNQLTHATVYAQQISAAYDEIKNEIGICVALIQILALLNQHLLSQHYLTAQVVRYTRRYGNKSAFEDARARARQHSFEIRTSLTKDAKQVVREYTTAWR